MPSDPSANARLRIALLFLFFTIVVSVGAWFAGALSRLQDRFQLDEALTQHPSNKFLQMTAIAAKAANETSAATEKLTGEIEPPALAKAGKLAGLRREGP